MPYLIHDLMMYTYIYLFNFGSFSPPYSELELTRNHNQTEDNINARLANKGWAGKSTCQTTMSETDLIVSVSMITRLEQEVYR